MKVKKDGIEVFGEEVTIAAGDKKPLKVRLEALPQSRPGRENPQTAAGPATPAIQKPEPNRTSGANPKITDATAANGFVPLFSGNDLRGWSKLEENGSDWRMGSNGVLTGSGSGKIGGGPALVSDRMDFANFTLKMRVRNSGDSHGRHILLRRSKPDHETSGYAVNLSLDPDPDDPGHTPAIGSIEKLIARHRYHYRDAEAKPLSLPTGQWYDLEISASGNHIETVVNGIKIAEYTDPYGSYPSGGIALLCWFDAAIEIQEMQIKELPPTPAGTGGGTVADESLQEAKRRWQTACEEARKKLLSQFDSEIEQLSATSSTRLAEALVRQREVFRRRGSYTWSSQLREPQERYRESMESAQSELERAFDEAIDRARTRRDDKGVAALTVEKQVLLAPRFVARCACVGGDGREWQFVFYSNGKLGDPDGPNLWTYKGGSLVLTVQVPDNTAIDTCTLTPDGKSFTGVNQWGYQYTAQFIDP